MPSEPIGEFQSIILCDDIRREDNGKLLLVGVYSGDIIPSSFPAFLSLRLYMMYDAKRTDKHDLDILFCLDEHEVARLDGTVIQNDMNYPVQMVLPSVPIDIAEPSVLTVFAIANNGDKKEILRKKVRTLDGATAV